jgi:hypothetical protein
MVQIGVGAWAERGAPRRRVKRPLRDGSEWRKPAIRIYERPRIARPAPAPRRAREPVSQQTDQLPQLRLVPIVAKPLQPFVVRESACGYLECRAAGRRCLATSGRPVDLDYQVAFCLGPRHQSCRYFQQLHPEPRALTNRRLAYAAAVIVMVGLLALAAVQAVSLGSATAMSRMVGLG